MLFRGKKKTKFWGGGTALPLLQAPPAPPPSALRPLNLS